jgi:hypothetical protein
MPSPPQGFTVILPGEITQSDLDPQQPPAKLSSYPLTIGKDTPDPNESNYVANDNTGNLLDIVNSDTSSTTLSALKMAIDALTIIRTNGELAINLANENKWSAAQSFTAGLATNNLDLNGAGPISALVSSFNGRTGAVIPASGDYTIGDELPSANESNYVANDNTGNLLSIVNSDTSKATLSALKMAIDDITLISTSGKLAINLANANTWTAAQSFTAGLATNTLNLNGTGPISALVSSFNGRTGAVVPVSGDYTIGDELPSANESNYVANDNTGNLLDIVNSDTSSITLSALKMAIDNATLTSTNGKLAIDLANGNTWSGGQTFTSGIATNSLNLNGAGYISALVSSFNGRTGAVTPAPGDYSNQTVINLTSSTTIGLGSSSKIGAVKTGISGVVLCHGFCLTNNPSSGSLMLSIGTSSILDISTMPILSMGATSTAGGAWSTENSYLGIGSSGYPVVLSGMTSLSPNTTYDVYLINGGSSGYTVEALNAVFIGL